MVKWVFPLSSELLKFLSKGGKKLKGKVNEELDEMGANNTRLRKFPELKIVDTKIY